MQSESGVTQMSLITYPLAQNFVEIPAEFHLIFVGQIHSPFDEVDGYFNVFK